MKLQIIVILLATVGIVTGIAQLGDGQISITVTSEGKAKISQSIFPETFVSSIDVHVISENISNLLAIDEENILLGTTQNDELLKIAPLGASAVDLKYNADILSYESGIFKLKYKSDMGSRVNLPPLSKLVSLNTIPIEITDEEYVLPPGDISLSFSIRPVTSKEFIIPVGESEYKIETITAAKIEEFSANSDEIQFIIKDKAIVLTIIPTTIMTNPNDALLNGEKVDFSQFHKNSTHSWIRIDPHEKGLVKILDTTEKTEEGGGCLIATATYGSEMAPQVQFLREIRDNQLMNTDSGVSFMTGFNEFYYSFSPHVANMERENPMFKEIVKIGITPLLSSLSVMEFAETDNEILGLGISVILMNIGMYFVLPFFICYQGMRIVRTTVVKKSSLVVISNCNLRSVLKIGLFGLVVLFVLSVSVPSAFAQSIESETDSPIKMILDMTLENLEESVLDPDREIPSTAQTFYQMGQGEYQLAIDALNEGDVEAAEEHALIAMALFEDSASVIGELEESLVLEQLPPGFGSAVGSTSGTGQGLGTGGIPSGIMKQLTAANVFDISEQITEIEEEVDELRQLAESNGVDVNLEDYDESINLAKAVLANGEIPNAQAKIELANDIKGEIYAEIQKAAGDNAREGIEELLEDQKNLGLTKKAINDLEDILQDLTTEETGDDESSVDDDIESSGDEAPGNSGDAPGQNKADSGDEDPGNSGDAPGQNKADSGDEDPGNSGDAPGQNKDNDETGLPSGFEAAGDNPSENGFANGNGLGIGKVPPGLAKKLFGSDELETGLPPGFEAAGDNPSENSNGQGLGVGGIPPGQLKKFEAGLYSIYSPDDYFEDAIDDLAEDTFEEKYDKLNKDSKSKEKSELAKQAKLDRIAAAAANGGPPGLAKKANDGITDTKSGTDSGTVGTPYIVDGFTAIKNGKDDTSKIRFDVFAPVNGTKMINNKLAADAGFTPDVAGDWLVVATDNPLADVTRTVTVASSGGGNTAPTITFSIGYQTSFCVLRSATVGEIDSRLADLDAAVVYGDDTTLVSVLNTNAAAVTGTSVNNSIAMEQASQGTQYTRIYETTDDDSTPLMTSLTVTVEIRNNYNGPTCTTGTAQP
jgi:hypothetical protein